MNAPRDTRRIFQIRVPAVVYRKNKENFIRLMPAGIEIRLRTTGTQRQKKTVIRPLLWNQASAFAISSPFRRRIFPTFPPPASSDVPGSATRPLRKAPQLPPKIPVWQKTPLPEYAGMYGWSETHQRAESPPRESAETHFPGKSGKRARDIHTAP